MKKQNEIQIELLKEIENMWIIDAHEHMHPEHYFLERNLDVMVLFGHYTRLDLFAAGMAEKEWEKLFDRKTPLETRWKKVKPYWEKIKYGSYAQAVLITIKKFYGISDINDKTYKLLSKRIKESNKPGIYDKILDACRIKAALTEVRTTETGNKRLIPIIRIVFEMENRKALFNPSFSPDIKIKNLDDYLDAYRSFITGVKARGAVGVKTLAYPLKTPDIKKAKELFNGLMNGRIKLLPVFNPLKDLVLDEGYKEAAKNDLVISVHSGYWGDFRDLSPLNMLPVVTRHKEAKFDIFHLGYPWIRETLNVAKVNPNVWLNLCWLNVVSEKATEKALDEVLDTIPVNKISYFGGDYRVGVQKIYGHLTIARRNLAKVFAKRVKEGYFSKEEALKIARMWLYDNPKQLYKLDV